MRKTKYFLILTILLNGLQIGSAESEPLDPALVNDAPYVYAGRVFAGNTAFSGLSSGSGTAVGPGIVLTAAHVYWTEAWEDGSLPEGASPWRAYQRWHPTASSSLSDSFDNVVSIVSLAGYDDALHVFDDNRDDGTSPFEAFNRDSLLLIFSDDAPTANGVIPIHPRAAESGFLGEKIFFEVVGYPSAKYGGSDSRKWLMHRTTERNKITVSKVPSFVYDAGYSFENRLYRGNDPLDSYAGNSGGGVIARSGEGEPWLLVGVYVGSGALFRGSDEELISMIDAASELQTEDKSTQFRFAAREYTVEEGGGPVEVLVERLGNGVGEASVELEIVDTTPDAGRDFTHSYDLQWAEGDLTSKRILIEAPEDELREGKETHLLYLKSDSLELLSAPSSALITVEDNDLNGPLDKWTIVDEVGAVDYSEVVFAEGIFVSVGGTNAIFWSPDYQDVGVVEFPDLNRLFQLTYAKGLFIGSGDGPTLIVSEDGREWETVRLPSSISVFSTQYGNGKFVAVGGIDAGSFSQGEVWVSENARDWTKAYDEQHDRFDDVEFGNGMFLARAGTEFYASNDGLNWSQVETTGLSGIPSDIEFGAGVFVNAGQMGGIYISEDGVDWALVREPDEEAFYGVGFRNGYFVATGISGKLSTSSDGGLTWIDRIPDTDESIWHGIAAAGKMTVIGNNGLLMTTDLPGYFDFIFEPVSQDILEGGDAGFFADFISSEDGPYTLQWEKDGKALVGEMSNTLTVSAVERGDEGEYRLIVSGGGTAYSSAVAVLHIETLINAPGNFIASTTTSRGVTLSWEDTSSGEEGFLIERKVGETGLWTTVTTVDRSVTRYTDRNLVPNTSYDYRVSPVSDEAVALFSNSTVTTLSATNMVNLSTRGLVGSGDEVMIGGFTIPPGPAMTLYIRGLGPSLSSSGIINTISNPRLRLVPAQGSGTGEPEIVNQDWMDADNLDAILATDLTPLDERESAMLVTLSAGAYTIILSSEDEEPAGIGMIEIFDATEGCDSCRLTNLSSRAVVSTDNELMIGGLVIGGFAEKQIFVRALGATLQGISSVLSDPVLKMVSGEGEQLVNDNWVDSVNADLIRDFGLPFQSDQEPGEVYQLTDGTYTFQISGKGGQTGVALLEIFESE